MRKDIYEINYENKLDVYQTQKAIKFVKDNFEKELAKKLDLLRVSAPLFVSSSSGLNDGLSGIEKPISFKINSSDDNVEIVHSLAKWKRMALSKYDIYTYKGIYTDMNAIRKDEEPDFIHSVYVDQWDWEKAILESDRTFSYLKRTVKRIYSAIYKIANEVDKKYPFLKNELPKEITFISTKELERRLPYLSRKEREDEITRAYGAVFIYQIGEKLSDGLPHDSRAADYDDWKLNGDILVYYSLYDMGLELSSMGIRVNKDRLQKQLKAKGELDKLSNSYCKSILNDELPQSIGGGIGQSRLCMFLLKKAHIGEVQVSSWDKNEVEKLKEHNIFLL